MWSLGIDSQPGGPVRQPYLTYRPARLYRLAESIHGLLIFEIERIHNSHANPSLRSFKLLGIHFDEHLNFNANTNALIRKLSRSIFFINRVKHTLTPKALKSLYTSFFHSHLLYCTNIYTCTSQQTSAKFSCSRKKPLGSLPNLATMHTQHHSLNAWTFYLLTKSSHMQNSLSCTLYIMDTHQTHLQTPGKHNHNATQN